MRVKNRFRMNETFRYLARTSLSFGSHATLNFSPKKREFLTVQGVFPEAGRKTDAEWPEAFRRSARLAEGCCKLVLIQVLTRYTCPHQNV